MKVKRFVLVLMAGLLLAGPANAQSEKARKMGKDIQNAVTDFWKKAKKGVNNTVEAISDELSSDTVGVKYIDGNRYMRVYDTNLYKESDAKELQDLCRKQFAASYPQAKILSCVIPQQKWENIPVRRNGDIVSYKYRLYCYVLAKDGDDGYINVRYRFEKTKQIGHAVQKNSERWPEEVRVNALTNDVYERLVK